MTYHLTMADIWDEPEQIWDHLHLQEDDQDGEVTYCHSIAECDKAYLKATRKLVAQAAECAQVPCPETFCTWHRDEDKRPEDVRIEMIFRRSSHRDIFKRYIENWLILRRLSS